MIHLTLIPLFHFNAGKNEAGDYRLSIAGRGVVADMWCSSMRWAIQDVEVELQHDLEVLFPCGYKVHFYTSVVESSKEFFDNSEFNAKEYNEIRSKMQFPIWRPDNNHLTIIGNLLA